jgi:hypothetical protein
MLGRRIFRRGREGTPRTHPNENAYTKSLTRALQLFIVLSASHGQPRLLLGDAAFVGAKQTGAPAERISRWPFRGRRGLAWAWRRWLRLCAGRGEPKVVSTTDTASAAMTGESSAQEVDRRIGRPTPSVPQTGVRVRSRRIFGQSSSAAAGAHGGSREREALHGPPPTNLSTQRVSQGNGAL